MRKNTGVLEHERYVFLNTDWTDGFCDGVAKNRGNPRDPCSRGIIELLKIIVKVVSKAMISV